MPSNAQIAVLSAVGEELGEEEQRIHAPFRGTVQLVRL